MNISLQNVDKVSALLTLKLEKADYQARVEKTLKTYRQKANIPGFRPGMVPMSLIKKQFGKSVLVEEVDKMMQEKVNEYIRDNKVASISEISDKFEVSTKQIEQWVREERLCFADDSPIGLQCECCGATIKTGRYCDKCKGTMANKLDNLYKAPAAAPRTGRDRDNARMRFLDK